MPTLPVPQAALVQCVGSVDNQMTVIDLSWVNAAAVTPVNLEALTIDVAFWFSGTLAPQLSDDWAAKYVVGIDLSDPAGSRFQIDAIATGGVSGEANPNNVAACVSLRTAQRGRSGHGRNYVPGIPGTMVTLNTLDPTFMSNILVGYNALVGAGTFSAGWQLCVVSRISGGVPRTPPITIPVTNCTFTSDKVRSMRSREVGHGA